MADPVLNHLTVSGFLKKRKIIVNNFLGGLAWGVGSVLGATVVVAILVGVLRAFNFIPAINDLTNTIDKTNQKLPAVTRDKE